MLDPFVDAKAHAETEQSLKATFPAAHIHPKEIAMASVLSYRQQPWFLCLLLRSVVQKDLKKVRRYVFFAQDHSSHVKQSQCLLLPRTSCSGGSNIAHALHYI